jgi:hypothetical protein
MAADRTPDRALDDDRTLDGDDQPTDEAIAMWGRVAQDAGLLAAQGPLNDSALHYFEVWGDNWGETVAAVERHLRSDPAAGDAHPCSRGCRMMACVCLLEDERADWYEETCDYCGGPSPPRRQCARIPRNASAWSNCCCWWEHAAHLAWDAGGSSVARLHRTARMAALDGRALSAEFIGAHFARGK